MDQKNMLFGTILVLSIIFIIAFAVNMKYEYVKIPPAANVIGIVAAAALGAGTMIYVSTVRGSIQKYEFIY